MAYIERGQPNLSLRVGVSLSIIALFIVVVGLRLWYLQVLNGEQFLYQSENNRLRTIFVPPPRGLILDRNGKVIVKNRPSFNIELVLEDCPDRDGVIVKVASLVKADPESLKERLKEDKRRRRFQPRLLIKDISRDMLAVISAHQHELPGIVINVIPAREYVYGSTGAHVVGYIREITREQLDSARYAGYQLSDFVGQYGLEARWEQYLQGRRGTQNVIVNATGTKIGEYSSDPEHPGRNLTLTIDLKVQQAAEEALGDKRGAVVAINPNNGEVLALSSHPSFDPNVFAGEVSSEKWKELTTDKSKPMNNRAVQGVYPPGSVFKVFMLAVGLSEGVISRKDKINCPGFYTFGGRAYKCHKHSGHGAVDSFLALVMSCDVYFYSLGQRLGIERIFNYATRFGFGKPTGLELVDENAGLIPSEHWKRTYFKDPREKKWFPGETLSVAIGQGATLTSPLQIARAVSALVNGGNVYRPILVKRIESQDGSFRDENFAPQISNTLDIDPKIIQIVKDAMVGVVNDEKGTGKRASLLKELNIHVGGKTGTSQVVGLDKHRKGGELDHHAWFVGYAPAERPEIVVSALVEHGGGGGAVAAPVVKKVMEAFFGYIPQDHEMDGDKNSAKVEMIAVGVD